MRPPLFDQIIKWIGLAATFIGAATTLLVAVGKFGEALDTTCRPFPSAPWCAAPASPKLAPYDSGTVDGPGNTQAKFCEPVAQAYRSQYPDFEITWAGSEGQRKDILGHVTRTYHCEFAATAKPRRSTGVYFALGAFMIGLLALVFYRQRATSR